MKTMPSGAAMPSKTELQPEQIADYLRLHPDFFHQHPELLSDLQIPHGSGTVSLVERQVTQLRSENSQMKKRLASLLTNAEINDELLEKTRLLIVRLLQADTPAKLASLLEQGLCNDLGADHCQVWTMDNYRMSGCKQLNSEQVALDLSRLVLSKKPHIGLLRPEETELLFPDQIHEVGSALIIPLFMPSPEHAKMNPLIGVLAIGNKDPDYYRDNMSTSILTYLSDIFVQLLVNTNKAQQPQSV